MKYYVHDDYYQDENWQHHPLQRQEETLEENQARTLNNQLLSVQNHSHHYIDPCVKMIISLQYVS